MTVYVKKKKKKKDEYNSSTVIVLVVLVAGCWRVLYVLALAFQLCCCILYPDRVIVLLFCFSLCCNVVVFHSDAAIVFCCCNVAMFCISDRAMIQQSLWILLPCVRRCSKEVPTIYLWEQR
jgi:hypothetical protein